jgi:hypothetical protein
MMCDGSLNNIWRSLHHQIYDMEKIPKYINKLIINEKLEAYILYDSIVADLVWQGLKMMIRNKLFNDLYI